MSADILFLELLVSGFFAIACFRARALQQNPTTYRPAPHRRQSALARCAIR